LPIDPAEKRKVFERLSSVREIVFGMQDGVLTTAGVLCGLSGAVSDHKQVVLAALASTAAGALSMGAGAYLGGHAETEIVSAELQQARRESEAYPYVIQESLLEQLSKEGLSRDSAYRVVKLLSTSQNALISTAEEKVYGLASGLLANPVTDGIVMGVAFMVGALVPLLPYFFIQSGRQGLVAALGATATVLFIVGYFEGWMSHRAQRWRSGIRFMAIAMSAAAAGYLIGLAI
jgi:VIT1/CCC1 family predicted Fe2+/Mn2+ transporter